MQASVTIWDDTQFACLRGEGQDDALEDLAAQMSARLAEFGLGLDDIVFHRFWARDRALRNRLRSTRERLFGGPRRGASSSFMSTSHIPSRGALAMEAIAFKAKHPGSRRVVEFTPPRAYAHYIVQDEWLFLSGMAEFAATMDAQFDNAFAEVERALEQENLDWRHVREATLFLEKGAADFAWLEHRFSATARPAPPRITFEYVDGLASVEKKLEIEIIAHMMH